MPKERSQPKFLHTVKVSFKIKDKNKIFMEKQYLKKIVDNNLHCKKC